MEIEMGGGADAYKMATEAGREAVKQLLVVTGGLLAGYLAFTGRTETAGILDPAWAREVITALFSSLFLGTLSLAFTYLMHAARSRFLEDRAAADLRSENRWQCLSLAATLLAFFLLLLAILIIVVTAYA
jgi:hypothetical protein